MNAFSLVNVLKRTASNSNYMKLLVFCHMISRNRRTFTLNFCRVMSVFGGRSPLVTATANKPR